MMNDEKLPTVWVITMIIPLIISNKRAEILQFILLNKIFSPEHFKNEEVDAFSKAKILFFEPQFLLLYVTRAPDK